VNCETGSKKVLLCVNTIQSQISVNYIIFYPLDLFIRINNTDSLNRKTTYIFLLYISFNKKMFLNMFFCFTFNTFEKRSNFLNRSIIT